MSAYVHHYIHIHMRLVIFIGLCTLCYPKNICFRLIDWLIDWLIDCNWCHNSNSLARQQHGLKSNFYLKLLSFDIFSKQHLLLTHGSLFFLSQRFIDCHLSKIYLQSERKLWFYLTQNFQLFCSGEKGVSWK